MRKLLLSMLLLALLLPVPGALADEDDLVVQVFNKTDALRIVSVTMDSPGGFGDNLQELEGGTEAFFEHPGKSDEQTWRFSIMDENRNEISGVTLHYSDGLFFPVEVTGGVSFSMDGQYPFLDITK